MPLIYSGRTVFFSAVLEVVSTPLSWLFGCHQRSSQIRKILVVEPFGMGDVLSLSVMLDPLKSACPDAEIRLLIKQGNEQIYAADSRVSRIYVMPVPWSKLSGRKSGSVAEWMKIWATCRAVAKWGPDIGLDSRSEIRSQILMLLSGCRRRIGFKNYLNTNINVRGFLLTDIIEKPPVMHRYAMNRLLVEQGLGIASMPVKFPSFKPNTPAERLVDQSPQVLIHIGARWEYKKWPKTNWIELGKRLVEKGVFPIFVGVSEEEMLITHIAATVRGATAVCTDMNRLIGLVKGSDLLNGLSSGPVHLAQTLGTPVVALFGPGDFELWRPQGAHDEVLFHRLPCNPCLQKECVRPDDSCMPMITVEEVFDAAQRVLAYKSEGFEL